MGDDVIEITLLQKFELERKSFANEFNNSTAFVRSIIF